MCSKWRKIRKYFTSWGSSITCSKPWVNIHSYHALEYLDYAMSMATCTAKDIRRLQKQSWIGCWKISGYLKLRKIIIHTLLISWINILHICTIHKRTQNNLTTFSCKIYPQFQYDMAGLAIANCVGELNIPVSWSMAAHSPLSPIIIIIIQMKSCTDVRKIQLIIWSYIKVKTI